MIFFGLSSWVPVLLWACLIYFLSSIPHLNSGLGKWDFILRKGAHIFEFTILTTLLFRAWHRTWNAWPWRRCAAMASLFALAYAASDEFHQSFVPGRGPSAHDVMIDSIGVLLALTTIKWTKMYE
jgi:VanZ family protein